jgi:hypothetical protein
MLTVKSVSAMALLALIVVLIAGNPAFATVAQSAYGRITVYTTGWSSDLVRVETTATFKNVDNCPSTDGYVTSPSDPGNHTHQAALLAAFLSGKEVSLYLDGCYQGRPLIIGVLIH